MTLKGFALKLVLPAADAFAMAVNWFVDTAVKEIATWWLDQLKLLAAAFENPHVDGWINEQIRINHEVALWFYSQ